jgi:hypothetical protein
MYNTYVEHEGKSDVETGRNHSCTGYTSENTSETAGDTGGSAFFSEFVGHTSGSKKENEVVSKLLCNDDLTSKDVRENKNIFKHVVSPEVMAAFEKCVGASEHGLHFRVVPSNDPDVVKMFVNYTPISGEKAAAHKIRKVSVTHDNQNTECEGGLKIARIVG